MTKKILLNIILLSLIILTVYGVWVIQPPSCDDLTSHKPQIFVKHSLPETGQRIRYYFCSLFFLQINLFSLFRVWSLITAIVSAALLWVLFIKEPILIRAALTLLTMLGFPYFGHIGPWNVIASMYTLSFIWMMAWYTAFRKIRYADKQLALKWALFFVLTFLAASWHEVWLVTFAAITAYFIFDAFSLLKNRDRYFKPRSLGIHLCVILGYILAVAFYTRGGPNQFIDARMDQSGRLSSLLNWPYMIKSFLTATKDVIVLIKDGLPVFLLIVYTKLNKRFQTKLSLGFKLFVAAALGSILFLYIAAFVQGSPDWRSRWLCMLSLTFALYAFPKTILTDRFSFLKNESFIRIVRIFSVIAAVAWLSYNTYFTYIYTNIDVVKYLRYRQMVLDHNPDVMKDLGHCTMPKDRPKGLATWDHPWGAQDDRYRMYVGPGDYLIYQNAEIFWNQNKKKK